ncbi:5-oxoprolinase subunit C family protein, partial [Actinocorallia lasiicapitis]
GPFPGLDTAPVAPLPAELRLRLLPGPRADWFTGEALALLTGRPYEATSASNRVGVRFTGPSLPRARTGELPSEGMPLGAVQVPPSGLPILFLADHPTTGGYPVIGVVDERDLPLAAQIRPGQRVRFGRCRALG